MHTDTPYGSGIAAAIAVIGRGARRLLKQRRQQQCQHHEEQCQLRLTKNNVELVVGTKSDDFYVTMECGAKAEAKKLGVKLTVNGPADFSVPEQAPILNAVAASKPDALIVAPTDTKALDPELTRIENAGTKVVFVDTTSTDPSVGVSRITTDNTAAASSPRTTWPADRRQGHRRRHQRQPGHQHHRRADQGFTRR